MNDEAWTAQFESPLADVLIEFIRLKRACGYRFKEEERALRCLDRFLVRSDLTERTLSRDVVDAWVARRPHESAGNHHCRVRRTRAIAEFARRQGVVAHVPCRPARLVSGQHFVPRVFTFEEIGRLLIAADALDAPKGSQLRRVVFPVAIRVLYSCGLRLGELQRLKVEDVDLEKGILMILDTKFRKDRLVPVSNRLRERLCAYSAAAGHRRPDDLFFCSRHGGKYGHAAYYWAFRDVLRAAGIGHGGRGHGPRLHDLRHTMAVHRLIKWYRAGVNLNAMLPVLAAYLGHQSLAGTQRYLRCTGELYPDIVARLEGWVGKALSEAR